MDWYLPQTPAPTREWTILQRLKLHVFHQDGERVMVLQSAGNLATTQSVISLLSARIATQQEPNLMQVTSLYDAAMLIGKTLQEVIQRDSSNQQNCGNTNFNCNLLLAGRSPGKRIAFSISTRKATLLKPRATPLFPDWREQIRQADHRPGVDPTPLEQAMCCALISIDSTLRSNLSVGLPLDTLLYRSGSLSSAGQHRSPKAIRIQHHSQGVVGRIAKHVPDLAALCAGRRSLRRGLR
jgi:putative proteasome-type protease